MTLYRVQTAYTRRYWRRGRLRQLARRLRCTLLGHDWSAWSIDDVDGPCEPLPNGDLMPLLARESRPGEFGSRACRQDCGGVQWRRPASDAGARGRLHDRDD